MIFDVSHSGIDQVGLAPDFIREVNLELTPPCCEDMSALTGLDVNAVVPGLDGPRGLLLVTEVLLRRGARVE